MEGAGLQRTRPHHDVAKPCRVPWCSYLPVRHQARRLREELVLIAFDDHIASRHQQ